MRSPRRPAPVGPDARLYARREEQGRSYWTAALGDPPSVYGERLTAVGPSVLRRWDPSRSKLAAALSNDWDGPLPRLGERWLYLGAATGTTASHVADLVGEDGFVFALERSVRPFARLLALARRYPNLGPVLGEARAPLDYLPWVPPVDGIYLDVAQPDQVDIAIENARWFLSARGAVLLALKTASMGRERSAKDHLAAAVERLEEWFEVDATVGLEPFHRRHYLVAARPTGRLFRRDDARPTPRAERRAGRRP